MDFNDLQIRLKRLSNALGKQFDPDIKSHTKVIREVSGDVHRIGFSFGSFDEAELNNRIFGVISSIAALKDHLKNRMVKLKKNPQLVEDMINNCMELQLIMDLSNQEKHGYPLQKRKHSNKDPQIKNLSHGLSVLGPGSGSVTFTISEENAGFGSSEGNMAIHISGQVVDGHDNFIMTTDDMIRVALSKIEEFMKTQNLMSGSFN